MILSSRGLKNIVCDASVFVFKVNGREFEISKFKAQFISPAVSRSLCLDPTQSSFTIEVPDGIECFESIVSLCEGNGISIEGSEVYGFGAVCRALGNDELIELVIGKDPVSISNVGLRLSLWITDEDVRFACEHFVSLDHSSLPVNILELLLRDDRLIIESEDWLLKIVGDRISGNDSLIGLLDYIECKYLSVEAMSTFVSLISHESMSTSVWSSICSRLQLPVSASNLNPREHAGSIRLNRSQPFDGVFAHLWRQCGKNPHSTGLIAISANEESANCAFPVYELITNSSKERKWWGSNNSPVDHYVKIDWKNMVLAPSGYSVKAHNTSWSAGGHFVRSWRFEGSNDVSAWEVLDSHTNSEELMRNDTEASFGISTTAQFRFLRFVMTGVNSSNTHQLSLQRLEVFGVLKRIR
jgi:hypothetical protein